jgi:hypothetical protein
MTKRNFSLSKFQWQFLELPQLRRPKQFKSQLWKKLSASPICGLRAGCIRGEVWESMMQSGVVFRRAASAGGLRSWGCWVGPGFVCILDSGDCLRRPSRFSGSRVRLSTPSHALPGVFHPFAPTGSCVVRLSTPFHSRFLTSFAPDCPPHPVLHPRRLATPSNCEKNSPFAPGQCPWPMPLADAWEIPMPMPMYLRSRRIQTLGFRAFQTIQNISNHSEHSKHFSWSRDNFHFISLQQRSTHTHLDIQFQEGQIWSAFLVFVKELFVNEVFESQGIFKTVLRYFTLL